MPLYRVSGTMEATGQARTVYLPSDSEAAAADEAMAAGMQIPEDVEDCPFANITGSGKYIMQVVGEYAYQESLLNLVGGLCKTGRDRKFVAVLIHEDDNPYDSNAIRIDIGPLTVGYLSKQDAVNFRAGLREIGYAGWPTTCDARVEGGRESVHQQHRQINVTLDFSESPNPPAP